MDPIPVAPPEIATSTSTCHERTHVEDQVISQRPDGKDICSKIFFLRAGTIHAIDRLHDCPKCTRYEPASHALTNRVGWPGTSWFMWQLTFKKRWELSMTRNVAQILGGRVWPVSTSNVDPIRRTRHGCFLDGSTFGEYSEAISHLSFSFCHRICKIVDAIPHWMYSRIGTTSRLGGYHFSWGIGFAPLTSHACVGPGDQVAWYQKFIVWS